MNRKRWSAPGRLSNLEQQESWCRRRRELLKIEAIIVANGKEEDYQMIDIKEKK